MGSSLIAGANFAVRGLRSFAEWVEIEEARVGVLYGPNASGKSALASSFLLLRCQRDLFRLSFMEGEGGFADFHDAARSRDPEARIDFRIRCAVDGAAALLPPGLPTPDPVRWNFELDLSYAADPFDGGQSGILVELSIDLVEEDLRTRIFYAASKPEGGELFFSTAEALGLPFVRARAIRTDEARPEPESELERGIAIAEGILSDTHGEAAARANRLVESLRAIRKEALIQREFERIVLAEPSTDRGWGAWTKHRTRTRSYSSGELKYLRSLADMLVAECLGDAGIRSMRSREGGREIRLSFYSVFGEILEAAGFAPEHRENPSFIFPASEDSRWGRMPRPSCATARGASRLVLRAFGDYAAWLRDTVNFALCADGEGRYSLEDGGLTEAYGKSILDLRQKRGGEALVPEGRDHDPFLLDIEERRGVLRDFLSECGLGNDLEFRIATSEHSAIMLVRDGERRGLGETSAGVRRLVVISAALLYLPWGSFVTVEEPEAGLDSNLQGRMADLLKLLARTTGATLLVETRSRDLVEAFGPYRRPETGVEEGKDRRVRRSPGVIGTRESEDGLVRVTELG